MNSVTSKWKIWLIIALAVVAAGMIMLGLLGVNSSVDLTKSYEVEVKADQDLDKIDEQVYTLSQNYFESKGVSEVCYASQKIDNSGYIFKFTSNPEIDADDLKNSVKSGLTETNVKISASVKEVVTDDSKDILGICLALGISAVAIFLFVLIKDKLKAGLAVFGASVVSSLLAFALVVITRVPATPILAVTLLSALLVSGVLSSGMIARFKEEKKSSKNEGLYDNEIADIAAKKSFARFISTFIIFAVFALALGLVSIGYLSFVAGHVMIVGAVSTYSAYVFTPLIWSAVKNNK